MSPKEHRDAVNERIEHHSVELLLRIGKLAFLLRLQAAFVLAIGIVFMSVGLFLFVSQMASNSLSVISLVILAIGLVVSSVALFMFRVASSFEAFESWSFRWAEPLIRSNRGLGTLNFFGPNDFDREDVRRAFSQPEFEYPEHPEYGYKLEDEGPPEPPRQE
jgi:hypothetical protein